MNPADLHRTDPTSLHGSSTPLLASRSLPTPTARPVEPEKKKTPRVDIEPIYTALKQGIGEGWTKYKEAISGFVQGHLTPTELNTTIAPLLSPASPQPTHTPDLTHLHNQLLTALYVNLSRDPPDSSGPAPFVSANDKPSTTLSKGATAGSDATEARLKSEVMHLPARERHRVKSAVQPTPSAPSSPSSAAPLLDPFQSRMHAYHASRSIRGLDPTTGSASSITAITISTAGASAASASAITTTSAQPPPSAATTSHKTNLDAEIKKRYLLPLSSETLEFPDADTLLPRLGPLCYASGLPAAPPPSQEVACAEFLAAAAAAYIKEALTGVLARVRSDADGCVCSASFRRRRGREEAAAWRGEVARVGAEGLLPVEVEARSKRRPLGMADLRVALEVGDPWVGRVPVVAGRIAADGWAGWENEVADGGGGGSGGGLGKGRAVEGGAAAVKSTEGDVEAMLVDKDFGWSGGAVEDRGHLDSLLDECLAVGV
ncbi:MAG: transcriptional coactivator hfi1/ADA1 [Bathelium mastoideum]|nr:MAG: transcriptional coactivator hfi1/ADA1 [Bathelium mastoideum]